MNGNKNGLGRGIASRIGLVALENNDLAMANKFWAYLPRPILGLVPSMSQVVQAPPRLMEMQP